MGGFLGVVGGASGLFAAFVGLEGSLELLLFLLNLAVRASNEDCFLMGGGRSFELMMNSVTPEDLITSHKQHSSCTVRESVQ